MRGEETQIAGACAERDGAMLAVLPGTHSKWAIVESGRLSSFATYMTGELYAVLLAHTLLGRMADLAKPSAVPPGPGFARGVERGLADAGLSHVIFGARTLALMGDLAPFDVPDWLSGALIGHEIRSARAFAREHGTDASEVTVIGADAIVARYAGALAQAGVAAHPGPTDAAARGLFEIACRAGIAY
jgi:2-dehydro-3-deoxygalactonokinase